MVRLFCPGRRSSRFDCRIARVTSLRQAQGTLGNRRLRPEPLPELVEGSARALKSAKEVANHGHFDKLNDHVSKCSAPVLRQTWQDGINRRMKNDVSPGRDARI